MVTTLVSLVIALIVTVFSLFGSLLAILVPIGIVVLVVRNMPTMTVQLGPVAGSQVSATDPTWVKRSRCRSCGSPQVRPSKNAYVYCDYCGELMDWDFQACLADKRSKLPGPKYVQLVNGVQGELKAAKSAGDKGKYGEVQSRIWREYAVACPAALSPRIGDERYRQRFVAWTTESQTECDFDPVCAGSFDRQTAATNALQWDRSDPFSPKATGPSFRALLAAVMEHQKNCVDLYERTGLLERHPDRPSRDLMMKMGVSALVQGWIPYLPKAEIENAIEVTGLKDEFAKIEPPSTRKGNCPCCGGPLEVVEGAKRVVCYACGHMAAVGGGTMPCHGCGSPVTVPTDANLFRCPACDAELRRMVWPS